MSFEGFENSLINSIIEINALYESDLKSLKKIGLGGSDSKCVYELLIRKFRRELSDKNNFKIDRNNNIKDIPQNIIDKCVLISEQISDEIHNFLKNDEDYKCDINNYENQSNSDSNNLDSYTNDTNNVVIECNKITECNKIVNCGIDNISIRFTDLNNEYKNSIANKFGYNSIDDFMVNNLQMNFINIGSILNLYESNKIKNNFQSTDIERFC